MKAAFFEITEDSHRQAIQAGLLGNELLFSGSPFEFSENLGNVEILGVFVNSKVTKNILEKLPNLKLIATFSTGFDHIDTAAAKERGVTVCNVPAYGENTVAEFAFALILSLSRKLYEGVKRVKERGMFSYEGLRGSDLKGKTIGIVGTGRIGACAIKIARGFGMEIVAYDPHPSENLEKEFGVKYLSLEGVLKISDIVSLHVPYMPSTHHLINKENLKSMKPSAVLVNTARGGLVDTLALVEALKSKTIAGAALDVLEEEGHIIEELSLLFGHPKERELKTVLAGHELMQMDNVIVTPHNAFNTHEAMERIIETSLQNIKAFIDGKVVNVVN